MLLKDGATPKSSIQPLDNQKEYRNGNVAVFKKEV